MSESDNEALKANSVDDNNEIDAAQVKQTAQRFLDEYEDALKVHSEKAAFDAAFTAASIDMHHDEMDKLVEGDPIAHGVDLMERSESEEFRNSVIENAREAAGEDLSKRLAHDVEEQTVENNPSVAELDEPIIATRPNENEVVDVSDVPPISASRDEEVDPADLPSMTAVIPPEETVPEETVPGETVPEEQVAEADSVEADTQEISGQENKEASIDQAEVATTEVTEVEPEQQPLAASSEEVAEVASDEVKPVEQEQEQNSVIEQPELAASGAGNPELDGGNIEISQEQLSDAIGDIDEANKENTVEEAAENTPASDVMGADLKGVDLKDIDDDKFVSDVNPQQELDELDKLLASTQNDVDNAGQKATGGDVTPEVNSNDQQSNETNQANQAQLADDQLREEEELEKNKKAEKQEAEYSRAAFMQKDDLAQNIESADKVEEVSGDFNLKEDEKVVVVNNEQNEGEGFSINKSASAIADFENTIKDDGTLVRTDKENPDNSIEVKFSQENGFEIDISNFNTEELDGGKYVTSIATDSGRVNFTIEDGDVTIHNVTGDMEGQLTIKNGDQELTLDKYGKMSEVAATSAAAEYSQPEQEQQTPQKEQAASVGEDISSQVQDAAGVAASTVKTQDKSQEQSADNSVEASQQKASPAEEKNEEHSKAFDGAKGAVVGAKAVIDAPGAMLDGVKNTAPVVAESVKTAANSLVTTAAAATDSASEKGLNAMAKIPDAMSSVNSKISGLLKDVSEGLKGGLDESLKKSSSLEKSWFSKAVEKVANVVESAAENRSQAAESYKADAVDLRSQASENAEQAQSIRESRDQMQEQASLERSILAAQLTGRADTAEKRKEQLAEMTKDENVPTPTESQKEVASTISDRVKAEGDLSKDDIEAIRKENKAALREVSEKDDGGHALKEENDTRLESAKAVSQSFEKDNSSITPELLESASKEFNGKMEEKLANDMTELDAAREVFEEVTNAKDSKVSLDADQQKQADELAYVASIALEAMEMSSDETFKAQAAAPDREEVERVNAQLLEKMQEYEDLPVHEAATKTYEDLEKVKDEVEANPKSTEEEKVNAANDWFAASDLLDKVEEDQGITEDYGTMKEFAMSKGGQVAALALLASGGLMSGVGVEAVIDGDPLLMHSGVAGTADNIAESSTPVADMVTEGWSDIIDSASDAVSEFIDSSPELVDSIGTQVIEAVDSPDQDLSNPDVNAEPEAQTPTEQDAPVIGTEIEQPDSRVDAVNNDVNPADLGGASVTTEVVDGHTVTTEVDGNSVKTVDTHVNEVGNTVTETTETESFTQEGDLGQKINGEANDYEARSTEVREELNNAVESGAISQEEADSIVSDALKADGAKGSDDKTTLIDRIEAGLEEALGENSAAEVDTPVVENAVAASDGEGNGNNGDNTDDITENKSPIDLNAATVSDDAAPVIPEAESVNKDVSDSKAEPESEQLSEPEKVAEVKTDKYDDLISEIRDAENLEEAKEAIKAADLSAAEEKRIEGRLLDPSNNFDTDRGVKAVELAQNNANTLEDIKEMAEEKGLSEAQEAKVVKAALDPSNNYQMERAERAVDRIENNANTLEDIKEMAEEKGLSEAQEAKVVKAALDPSNNYQMERAERAVDKMQENGEIKESEPEAKSDGKASDGKEAQVDKSEVKDVNEGKGDVDLQGATVTTEVDGNNVNTVDTHVNEAGNTVTETTEVKTETLVGDSGQKINGDANDIKERGDEVRNAMDDAVKSGEITSEQKNNIIAEAMDADDAKSSDDKTTLIDRIEAGLEEALGENSAAEVDTPVVDNASVENEKGGDDRSSFLNDAPDLVEESATNMSTGIEGSINAVGDFLANLIPAAHASDAAASIAIDGNDGQQVEAYSDFSDNFNENIESGLSEKEAFSKAINETAMEHPEIADMIQEDMGQLLANPEMAIDPNLQEIFNDAFVEKAAVISDMPEGSLPVTPSAAGESVLGDDKANVELSESDRSDFKSEDGYTDKDLDNAEQAAAKYGVSVETILETANLMEDVDSPEQVIRTMAVHPDILSGESQGDIAATLQDPQFTDMLVDIATDVLEASPSDIENGKEAYAAAIDEVATQLVEGNGELTPYEISSGNEVESKGADVNIDPSTGEIIAPTEQEAVSELITNALMNERASSSQDTTEVQEAQVNEAQGHDTSHTDHLKVGIDSTDDNQVEAYQAFLDNLDKLVESGKNEMEAYQPAVAATQETHPDITIALAEDMANYYKDGQEASIATVIDNAQEIIEKARIVVAEAAEGTLDSHIEGKPAMNVDADDEKNLDAYKSFADNFEKNGGNEVGADLGAVFTAAFEDTKVTNPEIEQIMKADSDEYFKDVESPVMVDVALSGAAFVEKANEVVETFAPESGEREVKENVVPDNSSIEDVKGEIQEVVSGGREEFSDSAIDVISSTPEVVAEVYNDNVVKIESAKNHESAVKAEVSEHMVEQTELESDLDKITAGLNGIEGGDDVHSPDIDTSKIAMSDEKSASSAREGRA